MSLPVATLFDVGRPAAVLLAVPAVVVDAINAEQRALAVHSWRPRSHVGEEGSERLTPACANGDAAGAVSMIASIGRIVAAPKHVLPDHVFIGRDAVADFGLTMSRAAFFGCCTSQTAAAFGRSGFKRIAADTFFGPAIAATEPNDIAAFTVITKNGNGYDNQAAEAQT